MSSSDAAATAVDPADPAVDPADLAAGLEEGNRLRCTACGNVTRFDVVASSRVRWYHHVDLGGRAIREDEEVLERRVESVTCRWCGRGDGLRAERAPAAGRE